MRETAEFCEFFYKAKKIEKDFAELTLTGKNLFHLTIEDNLYETTSVKKNNPIIKLLCDTIYDNYHTFITSLLHN